LRGGHTVTKVFTSSGPLYGKVREIDKVIEGNTFLFYSVGYDESGKILREVNDKGIILFYNYGADGKILGKTVEMPTGAKLLEVLKSNEISLLRSVEQAQNPDAKSDALQRLGNFYIHEMADPSKALDLLPFMSKPMQRFNIKWQL